MEKYAVIQLSGKQYLVRDGDVFEVERQEKQPKFDVLVYFDGKKHQIGEPILRDTPVKLTNVEDKKDEKIRVARFKSKSRYRKVKGHRQPISVLKVSFGTKKAPAKKTTKKSAPKKKVTKKAKK
jgi:large subunit ribosomal protein L21